MFGRLGPMELVLIFAIALIIFGPRKLPEIGKAIGSALRNFKRHANALSDELDSAQEQTPEADSAKKPDGET